MANSAGKIVVELGANLEEFKNGFKEAQKSVEGFGNVVRGFQERAGQFGFDKLVSAASSIPSAMAAAVSSLIDLGGRMTDLSSRTGIGTSALQKMEYAGKLVGVSLDTTTNAVGIMMRKLGAGTEAASAGFTKLGLSASSLKTMGADQALATIGEKIRALPTATAQASAAMEIFGRGGMAILPLLKSGFEDAGKAAEALGFVMSADVIAAGDKLGDSLDTLHSTFTGLVNNIVSVIVTSAPLHALISGITDLMGQLSIGVNGSSESLRSFVDGAVIFVAQAMVEAINVIQYAAAAWTALADVFSVVIGVATELGLAMQLMGKLLVTIDPRKMVAAYEEFGHKAAAAVTDARAAIESHHKSLAGLVVITEKVKAPVQALADAVAAQAGKVIGADAAHKGLTGTLNQETEAQKKATAAAKAHSDAIAKIIDHSTGKDANAEIKLMSEAWMQLQVVGKTISQKVFDEWHSKLLGLVADGGRLTDTLANVGFGAPMTLQSSNHNYSDIAGKTYAQDAAAVAKLRAEQSLVKKDTVDWSAALQDVNNVFSLLGITADSTLGRIVGGITSVIALGSKLKTLTSDSDGHRKKLSTMSSGDKMQAGLLSAQGLGATWQAAGGHQTKGGNMLGGAMTGAALGMSVAGPWGAAVGAVIGGIMGMFRSAWGKVAKEAGQVLGTSVSKELAMAIQKTSKGMGISIKNASLLHLTGAMAESGKDPRTFLAPALELIAGIAKGTIPAAAGIKELGSAFTQVADAAHAAGSVGDSAMVGMIQAARLAGVKVPEISAMVLASLQKAQGGVDKMLASFTGDGTGDKNSTVPGGENGYTSGIQMNTAQDAAQQGIIFSAVFWASVKEQGLVGAADAMGPALVKLRENMTTQMPTLNVDGILGPIERIMDLTAQGGLFRGAVEGVDGLKSALEGLADSGYLTADSFTAIQGQAETAFNQMIAGGATSQEALLAMAPMLQSLLSASQNYGIELDSNTQSLITQAQQNGVTFSVDPQIRMVNALEQIVKLMGGSIPDATNHASDSMTNLGNTGANTMDQLSGAVDGAASTVQERLGTMANDTTAVFDDVGKSLGGTFTDLADNSSGVFQQIASQLMALDGSGITIPITYTATGVPPPPGAPPATGVPPSTYAPPPGKQPDSYNATGFDGILHTDHLFQAHRGERVSIMPAGASPMSREIAKDLSGAIGGNGDGGGATHITIPLSLSGVKLGEVMAEKTKTGEWRVHQSAVAEF